MESTKAHCRIFDETEAEYGENYGMAYGALYNSNLFAKREEIAESIHQMKNYAYDHYTCAGKLVDEKAWRVYNCPAPVDMCTIWIIYTGGSCSCSGT